jgi:hypothetical protein
MVHNWDGGISKSEYSYLSINAIMPDKVHTDVSIKILVKLHLCMK